MSYLILKRIRKPNGTVYEYLYLQESWREGGKVKTRATPLDRLIRFLFDNYTLLLLKGKVTTDRYGEKEATGEGGLGKHDTGDSPLVAQGDKARELSGSNSIRQEGDGVNPTGEGDKCV